jgi:hypothetical protein
MVMERPRLCLVEVYLLLVSDHFCVVLVVVLVVSRHSRELSICQNGCD